MGASDWTYISSHEADLSALLERLRREVFAERDFFWPDDPHSDSWDKTWPADIAEIGSTDELRQTGTHSILDITAVVGEDAPDTFGTLRPLRVEERHRLFGTEKPTRADFEAGYRRAVVAATRWAGYAMTLYDADGEPAETAVWGVSGD